MRRALHEEVRFDTEKTTGIDWISHPSLRHADTPAKVDVVLVNGDPNPHRPDLPNCGAGETVCKPLIAAVADCKDVIWRLKAAAAECYPPAAVPIRPGPSWAEWPHARLAVSSAVGSAGTSHISAISKKT